MPLVHLIEGPIGAGKSTYAAALSERISAPSLCLDEWIACLFLPDRPTSASVDWYLTRKERCENQIWRTAVTILKAGSDVILELGLLTRENRQAFSKRASDAGFVVQIHVLDAPLAIRRERVRQRNLARGNTWHLDITDEMFERSNGWWEPLAGEEYASGLVIDIATVPPSDSR
ncbi:MAG: AAA family ATPase [Pseudomonadota bacterium]